MSIPQYSSYVYSSAELAIEAGISNRSMQASNITKVVIFPFHPDIWPGNTQVEHKKRKIEEECCISSITSIAINAAISTSSACCVGSVALFDQATAAVSSVFGMPYGVEEERTEQEPMEMDGQVGEWEEVNQASHCIKVCSSGSNSGYDHAC